MAPKTNNAPADEDCDLSEGKSASNTDHPEIARLLHGSKPLVHRWTDEWVQECVCVVFGLAFVGALAVVLLKQDGKPPPTFGITFGGALTLNTVISIIAAVAKALFLLPVVECVSQLKWLWFLQSRRPLSDFSIFDKASRGLLGGLTLIWRTRLRSLATLGVLLVLLGIVIDPFTQQLVAYSTEHLPTSSGPNVPISHCWSEAGFTAGSQKQSIQVGTNTTDCYSDSPDNAALSRYISSGMKGAVLQGLYSSNSTIFETPPDCPSGNCTINDYFSLAVCASVADVTSHLTNESSSGIMNTYVSTHQYINTTAGIMNVTSAAVGTQPHVGLGSGPGYYRLLFNDSIAFANTTSPLADAFIIVANSTHSIYTNDTSDPRELFLQKYTAYEFMLEWCVQSYRTTVENGVSTTQKLSALRNFQVDDVDMTLSMTDNHNSLPTSSKFAVSQMSHYSLQKYLQGLLSGWISGGDDQCWTATSDAILCLYEPFQLTANSDPNRGNTLYDVFNQLSNNGTSSGVAGLAAVLNNIATSMSNYVRSSRQNSCIVNYHQITHRGESYTEKIIVRVRWPWIAAHVVLACLSIVLLAATIVRQRRSAIGPTAWKSSSLATLHAVDAPLNNKLGGISCESKLSAQDRMIQVQLVRSSSEVWRLNMVDR